MPTAPRRTTPDRTEAHRTESHRGTQLSPTTARRRAATAFTLLELVVVIVVLGVLAALALPTFDAVIDRSRDATAEASLAAVLRDADALAALAGRPLPNADDLQTAFDELSASAPGVSAAGGYDVCAEGESSCAGGGDTEVRWDEADSVLGVIVMGSPRVLGRIEGASRPTTWTDPVGTLADALSGPLEAVTETAGPTVGAGVLVLNAPTAALDDVTITDEGSTTYVADDFNRPDGELGNGWAAFFLPPAEIVGNALAAPAGTAIAVQPVPTSSRVAVSGTIASLPGVGGQVDVSIVDTTLGSFESLGQVFNEQGDVMLRHLVTTPYSTGELIAQSGEVAQGDVVTLVRVNQRISRLYVNGVLRSAQDRLAAGALTGTLAGSADPTLCSVSANTTDAPDSPNASFQRGTATPDAAGAFSIPAPAGTPVKVFAWCPDTDGEYLGGPLSATAPSFTVASGASQAVGTVTLTP